MLRKIRLTLAITFISLITLLFLDFTGIIAAWFGWLAKIQFLPAVLALNVGIIIGLVAITLLFGRIYCSVICPLGVMQDLFSRIRSLRKKNRFKFTKENKILRYSVLVIFIASLLAGIGSIVALLAPYSAFGRIIQSVVQPGYLAINNLIADWAAKHEIYSVYHMEVWIKSLPVLITAVATIVVLFIMAWTGGRTYCNSICPVGTILGLISRYSIFKPTIDISKCNSCGLCSRNCKSQCIDSKSHDIDYSRCVVCGNCIDKCTKGAIKYTLSWGKKQSSATSTDDNINSDRRKFLSIVGLVGATATVGMAEKKVDGGLTILEDKKIPNRATRLVPPGAISLKNFAQHCTGCQLCVSKCPNQVLRPGLEITTFMQPEMHFDKGFCRPECTLCSELCPTGAILPICKGGKSATHIGHAVWVEKNCVVCTDDVNCGNCAAHCPTEAIIMVDSEKYGHQIPVINEQRCIGCGACEYLCPARPYSAIYVEGHEVHRND